MNHWLSVHLYRNDSLNELLTGLVKPLTDRLRAERKVISCFFIRYHDTGDHIRLRVSVAGEMLMRYVQEEIQQQAEAYYHENPNPGARCDIAWISYQQEIERYGGGHAIDLAEKMFTISSDAVLEWLEEQSSYPQPLLAGLLLHAAFVAVCVPFGKLADFLGAYIRDWIPGEIAHHFDDEGRVSIPLFDTQYTPQIQEIVTRCYDGALRSKSLGLCSLDRFINLTRNVHPVYLGRIQDEAQIMRIYRSLMHMTNNRLGIPNYDEAYLAYLLLRALE